MEEYFVFNIAIKISKKWFLPFQQFEIVGEKKIPMVQHVTRSGWELPSKKVNEPHYTIKDQDSTYDIPAQAGAVVNFKIPQEYVDRYALWESQITCDTKDFIKAAADYLNIDIRYRPESAKWYRERYPKKKKQTRKVGKQLSKHETKTD